MEALPLDSITVIPRLTPERLPQLVVHGVLVTLASVGFVRAGPSFRLDGIG